MEQFKPTIGIEPTNKYDKAKQDLIQAMSSISELSQQEQEMLAKEVFGAARIAAVLNAFNGYSYGNHN